MENPLNRILLIDDDRITNLMHRRLIARHGLARLVDDATDGQSALDYLKDQHFAGELPPELVLLDINMPRMNGFEFLKEYSHFPASLHENQCIIMVSTSALKADRDRAEADPFVRSYKVKPLQNHDLIDIVALCKSLVKLES